MPEDPFEGILDAFRLFAQIQGARDRQQSFRLRQDELDASKRFREDQQVQRTQTEQRAERKQTAGLLSSGAVPLNPTEQGFLRQEEAGELGGARLRIPLTEGVSARAAGRTVASSGGELFIPSDDDSARRDLAQRLEQETSVFRVKNPEVPPQLAADLGLPSTTRVPPSSVSTLVSARERKTARSEPKRLTFHTFDNDKGQRIRVGFDAQGREVNRTVVGKTGKRGLTRKATGRDQKEQKVSAEAGRIFTASGNDPDQALKLLEKEAVGNAFLTEHLFDIRKLFHDERRRSGRGGGQQSSEFDLAMRVLGQGTGEASADDIGSVEASDVFPLSEEAQRVLQQVQ